MHIKFLPEGYILDSGAPTAFLREGVQSDELFFVMGWTLTSVSNKILKEVINHTRNIQGKDFERLPYPIWVSTERREQAVELVKKMIRSAQEGVKYTFASKEISELEALYEFRPYQLELASEDLLEVTQPSLF